MPSYMGRYAELPTLKHTLFWSINIWMHDALACLSACNLLQPTQPIYISISILLISLAHLIIACSILIDSAEARCIHECARERFTILLTESTGTPFCSLFWHSLSPPIPPPPVSLRVVIRSQASFSACPTTGAAPRLVFTWFQASGPTLPASAGLSGSKLPQVLPCFKRKI
jgi:hypothetical protein